MVLDTFDTVDFFSTNNVSVSTESQGFLPLFITTKSTPDLNPIVLDFGERH